MSERPRLKVYLLLSLSWICALLLANSFADRRWWLALAGGMVSVWLLGWSLLLFRREDPIALTFKPDRRPPLQWLLMALLGGVLSLGVGSFYFWQGMTKGGLSLLAAVVVGPVGVVFGVVFLAGWIIGIRAPR